MQQTILAASGAILGVVAAAHLGLRAHLGALTIGSPGDTILAAVTGAVAALLLRHILRELRGF